MRTTVPSDVRALNQGLLLKLIWNHADISRADLARRAGMSRSTVSGIVSDLLAMGLVREQGARESEGGRPAIRMRFEDEVLGILGLDIGASHVSVAISNLRGKVRFWNRVSHPVQGDPEGTLALAHRLLGEAVEQSPWEWSGILGLGIAVPSPVHPDRPGYLSEDIVPKWADIDLIAHFEERYGLPVFVDNDANLGALSEVWWGAGREGGDLAYIKVGTGVGCGLFIGGDIFRGNSGLAGEIGHIVIDAADPREVMGLRGCLVAFIGAASLAEQVEALLPEHPGSLLAQGGRHPEEIAKAALAGDALGKAVVEGAGENLGIAVATVLSLLNPDTIVLGGEITQARELLLDPVRRSVSQRTLWNAIPGERIQISALGDKDIVMGAVTRVLAEALGDNQLFERTIVSPQKERRYA